MSGLLVKEHPTLGVFRKAYDAARYQALKQDSVKLEQVKSRHKEWVDAHKAHLAEYARQRRAERRMKLCGTGL